MSGLTYTARETQYLYFETYGASFWGAYKVERPDPTGYYPGPERLYEDFETYEELLVAAKRGDHPDPKEFRTLVFHPHTDALVLNLLWDHTKTQKPDHSQRNRHFIVESAVTTERLLGKFWRETQDPWIREKVLRSSNCTERLLLLAKEATDRVSLGTTRGWTMPELADRLLCERKRIAESINLSEAA